MGTDYGGGIQLLLKRFPDSSVSSLILTGWFSEVDLTGGHWCNGRRGPRPIIKAEKALGLCNLCCGCDCEILQFHFTFHFIAYKQLSKAMKMDAVSSGLSYKSGAPYTNIP